ncbi:hypothetical protein AAEU33_18705 [Chryseobacterium sp. Chry.R1]|uniref:hypothetical protein n=1 Tax=Chryseobacterium sp. Chry.R1 TaxID=3139392 RepID=UPI0031F9DDD3
MTYHIKNPEQLTVQEIGVIIKLWENKEWTGMKADDFRQLFKNSEFHLLLDTDGNIKSVLRLNFDFTLKISGNLHSYTEMVGFVSAQKGHGYGSQLLKLSAENVTERDLQVIGFCISDLRPFYKKCKIDILYDKAKKILEQEDDHWISSEDDDILIIHLSEENRNLFKQLDSEKTAYLIQ